MLVWCIIKFHLSRRVGFRTLDWCFWSHSIWRASKWTKGICVWVAWCAFTLFNYYHLWINAKIVLRSGSTYVWSIVCTIYLLALEVMSSYITAYATIWASRELSERWDMCATLAGRYSLWSYGGSRALVVRYVICLRILLSGWSLVMLSSRYDLTYSQAQIIGSYLTFILRTKYDVTLWV